MTTLFGKEYSLTQAEIENLLRDHLHYPMLDDDGIKGYARSIKDKVAKIYPHTSFEFLQVRRGGPYNGRGLYLGNAKWDKKGSWKIVVEKDGEQVLVPVDVE